jgi:hypothetical protein
MTAPDFTSQDMAQVLYDAATDDTDRAIHDRTKHRTLHPGAAEHFRSGIRRLHEVAVLTVGVRPFSRRLTNELADGSNFEPSTRCARR